MVNPKNSYCADTVRRYDRDRFLLGLAAAKKAPREALWALFAFNHEIAKTREVVTEPLLGQIRLQWWCEAIEGLYAGKILKHEVIEALAPVIRAHDLPQADFQALIEAREADLEGKAPASFMDAELYADRTATPLNRLALKIIGQEEDDKTVRAVSIGYALTGLLRAVPFHAAQGRKIFPRGEPDAPQIVTLARRYFDSVTPQGRYLRTATGLGRHYLKRIEKLDYRLSDPRLGGPSAGFTLKALAGIIK